MEENNKLAVIYARVSTDDQVQRGISIPTQEAVCREMAVKEGFDIFEVIKDEGRSGGDMERPGIKHLRKLVEEKTINAVFVIHADRLARNTAGHIELMNLFDVNKVKLKSVYQPDFNRSTATGLMNDTIMAVFSEHFRKVISEKTLSSMEVKAKEGWFPSTPPIGYITVVNPHQGNGEISKHIIIPDAERASFITEAFRLYATGNYTVTDIQNQLYQEGLRTKRGARTSLNVLYQALQNIFYTGQMDWRDIHVDKGRHQPLIDRSTFDRVQGVIATHNQFANRTRKHWFLLRGLAMCNEHRTHRYTASLHKKKSGLKFAYYHCSNQRGCPGGYTEVDTLESEVAALFKSFKFSNSFIEKVVSKAKAKFDAAIREQGNRRQIILKQEARLLRKRSMAEDKLFKGILPDEDFTRIRNEVAQELTTIKRELEHLKENHEADIDIAQEVLLLARDVPTAYRKAPPRIKQQYHRIFFKQVFIFKGRVTEIKYSEFFEELVQLQALNHVKPTENIERVKIRAEMGA